jgi:alpha-glucosidase (family GH31 glycosyl hydrolase)
MRRICLLILVLVYLGGNVFSSSPVSQRKKTPPIVPAWAFVPWIWEDSINTQEGALKLVKLYREHKIPVGAIIIDSPWSTAYNNFLWDHSRYPNPQGMINELHKNHVRVIMWLTGFINRTSKDVPVQKCDGYDYVKQHNYAVDNSKEHEWWKGKGIHIDFTNPDAVKWFDKQLDKILDMHIDGFKIDNGFAALNKYSVMTYAGEMRGEIFGSYYYDSIAAYGLSRNPEFVNFARGYSYQATACSGTDYIHVTFQGDFSGDWYGLKHQINNTYKTARLGYGAPGFEIGGFMDQESSKKEFVRYAQFGSMCPLMENGGSNGAFSAHLPWFHGRDVINIYRYYATLHNELAPYLFSASVDAHLTGNSIINNTSLKENSHQLGRFLFIKAITNGTGVVDIILPAQGQWIDYWSGKIYQGGTILKDVRYELDHYPIFVKAGAVIPMQVTNNITGHGDEHSQGKQTVLIYPEGKVAYTFHKPAGSGIDYNDVLVSVNNNDGTLSVHSVIPDDYLFMIKQDNLPKKITGADSWEYLEKTHYLRIEKKGKDFVIRYK